MALESAKRNVKLNQFEESRCSWHHGDVFSHVRQLREEGKRFDIIVVDPPKLAPTVASVERAARAYKDVNLLSMQLLKQGGYLATFSCSGGVSMDLFRKIIAGSAADADGSYQVFLTVLPE